MQITTVNLNRKDYLEKAKQICTRRAYQNATDWGVKPEQMAEFIKLDVSAMFENVTPKRGSWSIIDDDGVQYETAKAYKPYAPMQ